jgi:hypothetical protein
MPSLCPYPEKIQSSLHILGFNDDASPPSSLKELNKRYHLLALKHHPDKAELGDPSANEKFKEINDAHKRLKDYFYSGYRAHDDADAADAEAEAAADASGYDNLLQMFIKSIIVKIRSSATDDATTTDSIHAIIQTVLSKGAQSAVMLFRNMDKPAAITIYDILSKNQDLFGISREMMDELTEIIETKTRDDIVIHLNPSLLDMLMDRVYILNECGKTYYIPLWHSELHFNHVNDVAATAAATAADTNVIRIIVVCQPELPDNVSIDEFNNMYISLDVSICELFTKQVIPVIINDELKTHGFVYELHARDVCLQSTDNNDAVRQCVLLRGAGKGIARYNTATSDIYKVGMRANVYANIHLTL